jgi:hypothetical protein
MAYLDSTTAVGRDRSRHRAGRDTASPACQRAGAPASVSTPPRGVVPRARAKGRHRGAARRRRARFQPHACAGEGYPGGANISVAKLGSGAAFMSDGGCMCEKSKERKKRKDRYKGAAAEPPSRRRRRPPLPRAARLESRRKRKAERGKRKRRGKGAGRNCSGGATR